MIQAKGLAAALLFVYCTSAKATAEEFVRVRIAAKVADLEITGQNIRVQGQEEIYRPVAIPKAANVVLVQQVTIRGQKSWKVKLKDRISFIAKPFLAIQGQMLQFKSKYMPDRLVLDSETRDLIAVVPMEEYVKNVIANEMPIDWPIEALKAQAIIARSYVKAMQKTRAKNHYDVESSVLDQVFQLQIHSAKNRLRLQQIIAETRGVTLNRKDQKIAKTFYHSDCGGSPEGARNIWSPQKVQVETDSGTCIPHEHRKWTAFISNQEMKAILKHENSSTFRLSFLKSPVTERVAEVVINSGAQDLQTITAEEFRRKLGYSRIKSTLFTVTKQGGGWTFSGTGNGHGVGLCQWGAKSLAANGANYQRILKVYYPDLVLQAAHNTNGEEQNHRHDYKTL